MHGCTHERASSLGGLIGRSVRPRRWPPPFAAPWTPAGVEEEKEVAEFGFRGVDADRVVVGGWWGGLARRGCSQEVRDQTSSSIGFTQWGWDACSSCSGVGMHAVHEVVAPAISESCNDSCRAKLYRLAARGGNPNDVETRAAAVASAAWHPKWWVGPAWCSWLNLSALCSWLTNRQHAMSLETLMLEGWDVSESTLSELQGRGGLRVMSQTSTWKPFFCRKSAYPLVRPGSSRQEHGTLAPQHGRLCVSGL
eukprot:365650-Chlamydomonas_euryale.AAC.1